MNRKECFYCGEKFAVESANRMKCHGCYVVAYVIATRAVSAVAAAVNRGDIERLSDVVVGCVDCKARAVQYDHRDYSKPLLVAPVCCSCNKKRGPAEINIALIASVKSRGKGFDEYKKQMIERFRKNQKY